MRGVKRQGGTRSEESPPRLGCWRRQPTGTKSGAPGGKLSGKEICADSACQERRVEAASPLSKRQGVDGRASAVVPHRDDRDQPGLRAPRWTRLTGRHDWFTLVRGERLRFRAHAMRSVLRSC